MMYQYEIIFYERRDTHTAATDIGLHARSLRGDVNSLEVDAAPDTAISYKLLADSTSSPV